MLVPGDLAATVAISLDNFLHLIKSFIVNDRFVFPGVDFALVRDLAGLGDVCEYAL
jgi:hypothetical protein